MRHRVRDPRSGVALGWVDEPGPDAMWSASDDRWSLVTKHETRSDAEVCITMRVFADGARRAEIVSELTDMLQRARRQMLELDEPGIGLDTVAKIIAYAQSMHARIELLRNELAMEVGA